MCGIAGAINSRGSIDIADVEKMRDSFAYRGPDDKGIWFNGDNSVVIGHRRLSIIDTSFAGHQPMVDRSSNCVIVYNGEVYNYREIRKELEAKGYKFETETDTEVVLKSYIEFGTNCVHRFNGMFAIAIYDPKINSVVFFRDRLGIKPVYYLHEGGQFYFASEAKAINNALSEKRGVNAGLIDDYMSFGYIPGEETLQQGIKKLLPGHHAIYDLKDASFTIDKYWDLVFDHSEDLGFDYYVHEGRRLLNSAIDLRLRSDVPLGIFLSGGLDSSAVVGLLAGRTEEKLQTYSVAYDFGVQYDETPYARMVAEKFGTEHSELYLKPDTFRDFIPEYVRLMDEPVTESAAISLYFLSKMASKDVTVVLSGEGSDEIFGGYDLYRYMMIIEKYRAIFGDSGAKTVSRLSSGLGLNTTKLGKYLQLASVQLDQRYKGISTYDERVKSHLYSDSFKAKLLSKDSLNNKSRFLEKLFEDQNTDSLGKMLYFDTKTWLVDDLLIKADRMSMAASLELRVPFLDFRLVEFAATIPSKYKIRNGQGKYILKKMMEGLLPKEIVYRKKMGFPTPLKLMFQGVLKDYSSDLLLSANARISNYFRSSAIEKMLKDHQLGNADHHRVLWQLVVLEEWLQQHG